MSASCVHSQFIFVTQSPREISDLACWYQQTAIPYLKVKVEQLHLDPAILMYHDVISDSEIDAVKNVSMRLVCVDVCFKWQLFDSGL